MDHTGRLLEPSENIRIPRNAAQPSADETQLRNFRRDPVVKLNVEAKTEAHADGARLTTAALPPRAAGTPAANRNDFVATSHMISLSRQIASRDEDEENEPPALSKYATSWAGQVENRNGFQLLSRRARRWKTKGRIFEPWDFSKISSAAVELTGRPASAERPSREGVCGSYFIRTERDILGVFKPIDEEAGGTSNRSAQLSNEAPDNVLDFEKCFKPGGGAFREVAAYLLDHKNFANVPQTALAHLDVSLPRQRDRPNLSKFKASSDTRDGKNGAFQVFVSNLGDADDFGPGVFFAERVQRIAVLDVRVLNCDRHGGNLLVVRSELGHVANKYELVPIDHGFILPETVPTCPWPVWMDWNQAKLPVSDAIKKYVYLLDAEMDARILKEELEGAISSASLAWLRVSTHLLKKGIQAGLTMYDIGCLVFSRNPQAETSDLAKVTREALEAGFAREERMKESVSSLNSSPSSLECDAVCSPADDIFRFDDDTLSTSSRAGHEGSIQDQHDFWCRCLMCCTENVGEISDTTWEYVVKYACRLIDDILRSPSTTNASPQKAEKAAPGLGRVRSIPEFASMPGAKSSKTNQQNSPNMARSFSRSNTAGSSPVRLMDDSRGLHRPAVPHFSLENISTLRGPEQSRQGYEERLRERYQLPALESSLSMLFGTGEELAKSPKRRMISPVSPCEKA